jgi:hypothetical protein
MISRVRNFLINDEEIDSGVQRLLSLIFLFVAGLMSFISYTHIGKLWNTQLSFTPGFVSTILGLALIAPLYMRNILKWNRSIYTILTFVMILLVFSSFVELATGGNIPKKMVTYSLLTSSIVLSWLGIRGVAGISWILLLVASVYSLVVNDLAFGFSGFIYITFGFLGLLMHTGLNPGELMSSIKNEYSPSAVHAVNSVKTEVKETGTLVKEAGTLAKDVVSLAAKIQ